LRYRAGGYSGNGDNTGKSTINDSFCRYFLIYGESSSGENTDKSTQNALFCRYFFDLRRVSSGENTDKSTPNALFCRYFLVCGESAVAIIPAKELQALRFAGIS